MIYLGNGLSGFLYGAQHMRVTIFKTDDDEFGYIEGWDIRDVCMQGIEGYRKVEIDIILDRVSSNIEHILKNHYEQDTK